MSVWKAVLLWLVVMPSVCSTEGYHFVIGFASSFIILSYGLIIIS